MKWLIAIAMLTLAGCNDPSIDRGDSFSKDYTIQRLQGSRNAGFYVTMDGKEYLFNANGGIIEHVPLKPTAEEIPPGRKEPAEKWETEDLFKPQRYPLSDDVEDLFKDNKD